MTCDIGVFPFQCKIVFTELLSGVVLTLAVSYDTVEIGGGEGGAQKWHIFTESSGLTKEVKEVSS